MAARGLLSVWNDVVPDHEAEFNDWYDHEHVLERLSVPGILSGRRYAGVGAKHHYAALYDLDSVAALASPPYLKMLANATPRTRAIMPQFRAMNRAVSEVRLDLSSRRDALPVLAIVELAATATSQDVLDAAGRLGAAIGKGAAIARLRLAVPDAGARSTPNPEAGLRPGGDRVPGPFLLAEGEDDAALEAAAKRFAEALSAAAPRLYHLLSARP